MSKFVKFEAQVDGYLPELFVKVDNILMVTIDDVYFTQGSELKERETQDCNYIVLEKTKQFIKSLEVKK